MVDPASGSGRAVGLQAPASTQLQPPALSITVTPLMAQMGPGDPLALGADLATAAGLSTTLVSSFFATLLVGY